MIKNLFNKSKHESTFFSFIIFAIFVLAFSIRIYGTNAIRISNSEAEVLLSVTGIKHTGTETFFYTLIIQALQFLGIDGKLELRLINVLIGSLIVILPALFSEEIGKRAAILTSLFIAFDPFGIVNSIVFSGNSATILLVGLLVDAIMHKRENIVLFIILLLIGHGRGLGYFFITSLLFFIILLFIDRNTVRTFLSALKEKTSPKKYSMITGLSILLVLILSIIIKNPLSNIAKDSSNFILGWGKNYQIGNYPIVYPFVIISYTPFVLIAPLIFLVKIPEIELKKYKLVFLWLALALIIITFYPDHLMTDLVWVSLPSLLIISFLIGRYLSVEYLLLKDNLVFVGILLITGINLGLNIVSLVYRSIWGLDITNTLFAILLISIFTVVILIFRAYTASISKALSALFLVTFIFCGFLQLSISARAAGSNQKPENEILWNGYFEGQDIFGEIIQNTISSISGTSGFLNIYVDGQINPSVLWALKKERLLFQRSDLLLNNPEVVVSSNQPPIEVNEDIYQGQEFVSNSYPLWTWDPLGSFISTDYWNWFFFRNNLQYKEYNSIWINKTMVDKKITIGVN